VPRGGTAAAPAPPLTAAGQLQTWRGFAELRSPRSVMMALGGVSLSATSGLRLAWSRRKGGVPPSPPARLTAAFVARDASPGLALPRLRQDLRMGLPRANRGVRGGWSATPRPCVPGLFEGCCLRERGLHCGSPLTIPRCEGRGSPQTEPAPLPRAPPPHWHAAGTHPHR
jgi:hypothetical protein